ncbi:mothers against decapentaplegic homolog 6 [Drosophila serrata]|uniref:mothers against decapentaplegic homolog 6 n=1 Tax=Drosophila serrata TaxID=7274 RepID=UPI000A1D0959|nr:mothers against decapentaplegic homolog 6 [Drosophila serrata]
MIFPSEKKKDLWRYALKNNPGTREGVPPMPPSQLPRPPPPPHRPRPHLHHHQQQQQLTPHPPSLGYSCDEDSLAMRQTPPPPYNSMPCAMDCSGSSCQSPVQNNNNNNNNNNHSHPYRRLPNPRERELSPLSCGSACDRCCTAPGCSCANSCDDMLIEESDLERERERNRYQEQQQQQQQQQQVDRRLPSANTFATMFRKCCGSGTESTSGSSTSSIPAMMQASPAHQANQTPAQVQAQSLRRQREDFDALIKPLKRKQVAELLLAVKSRVDLPTKTQRDAVTTTTTSSSSATALTTTTPPTYLQCILIPCSTRADREQYVTASRLFFWPGLRSGEELKRLPACQSVQDCVYTCCNPLHWCRIVHLPEPQPPPYHRSKMQRLKDADPEEDLQNDTESAALSTWSARSSSISASSIFKRTESPTPSPTPQLFESFATDGKDSTIGSKGWCQIAYWELAHRVGEFFHARTNAVNIYTDGIVDSGGDSMCLRDLTLNDKQVSSEVVNTRKKVGLGVTLSLECGDVWIYNRGNSAVFVDSPTLAERLDRVCKVMPGCCLKAFETNRAQWLSMRQPGHHHMGPIDWFSLKISFAKGWGNSYTRQDIMGCPCWVEVHFSHLR